VSSPHGDRAGGGTAPQSLIITGLVLLSLCLRAPLVAVSAVSSELITDLGMTSTGVGLLTSLPVLCFGLAAPGASAVIARFGVERGALISLVGILIGIAVRSAGGIPLALVGTVIMGVAITIGNVVVPLIIGRDFRDRAATLTGGYTAVMNIGAMLTLTTTGPLAAQFGWQVALGIWVILPLIALLPWLPLARRRARSDRLRAKTSSAAPAAPKGQRPAGSRALWRRPSTWMLTFAFAGQAFAYYGLTAWLPTLLGEEQGMTTGEAGAASSVFQICALFGAVGMPVIINRFGPLTAFLVTGSLWATLPLGLLFATDQWAVWNALAGVAQGSGFVCVFTVVVLRAASLRENRQLSSFVQTGGYTIAALGPVVLGGLHDSSGGWDASLLAALIAILALTVLGSLSTRGIPRR
jgi:CP family cyanate transporter-like MFS transporter